jgi:hypothetical protein
MYKITKNFYDCESDTGKWDKEDLFEWRSWSLSGCPSCDQKRSEPCVNPSHISGNNRLSDYVTVRLSVARAKAMSKYQEVWASRI